MNVMEQAKAVAPLCEASARVVGLARDIRTIRQAGVKEVELARVLGVTPRAIQLWQRGRLYPRDPMVFLSIMFWADELRAQSLAS